MLSVRMVVPHPRGWDIRDDTEIHDKMFAIANTDGLVPYIGTFTLGLATCVISLGVGPTWTISLAVATHRPNDAACEMLRLSCHIDAWQEVESTGHARYFQIPAEVM